MSGEGIYKQLATSTRKDNQVCNPLTSCFLEDQVPKGTKFSPQNCNIMRNSEQNRCSHSKLVFKANTHCYFSMKYWRNWLHNSTSFMNNKSLNNELFQCQNHSR